MKRLKRRYIIPIFISCLTAIGLSWFFFPPDFFIQAILCTIIPLVILAIGFRIITQQRIQIIRNQLYQIFQSLEEFDVDEPKKVKFEASPFPMFNELNVHLIELIDRIHINYQANKQFTQNASHELQTPLAIIKGHIELLLQSKNIGEKEMNALVTVLQYTNRLSKLNSALILLSKIEHQQFIDTEEIDFVQVTDEHLKNFKDLIQIQGIKIRKNYKNVFTTRMSKTLAEMLVANLIQNAIRHNSENGFIEVNIDTHKFSIQNPGKTPKVSTKSFFKRFKRESNTEESLGLGLSIVKRICEQSDLHISYQFNEGLHHLILMKTEFK